MNRLIFLSAIACSFLMVSCYDDSSSPSKASGTGRRTPTDMDDLNAILTELYANSSSSANVVENPLSSSDVSNGTSATSGPLNLNRVQLFGCELTGLEQFKYGRFEARMKMAAVSGSVSSMFLNYDNSWMKKNEPWNEIDIEILGKNPAAWQSNLITREPDMDGKVNKNITSEKVLDLGFNATEEFHLYAIIWTPEYIAWEIDSVEVRRDVVGNPDGLAHDQVAFMTEMQSLRFNLWVSNSPGWTGKFTGEGLPVEQQIDYVRVYSYDEATKAFTFSWQDDFDGLTLDTKRWSRGNWEMEKVMYRPSNVKVRDGHVSIILDYEEI